MKFTSFATVSALALTAAAQTTSYCDSNALCYQKYYNQDFGVSISIASPTSGADEFILEVTQPDYVTGWVGVVLGDSMYDNLMLAVWPNGQQVVVSPRMANGYVSPAYQSGPTLEMLPSSGFNSTDGLMTATFKCVGCISQSGLNMDSTWQQIYWALGRQPAQPADPTASIPMFTYSDDFVVSLAATKTDTYDSFA